MTPLQQKELQLLAHFVRICEALKLRYYLVCGTALGAVKYRGFIPWDDDVDVAMPREDYETFLREAPALLPEGIFLQNYRTDPAFPQIFSKLRDSGTTYLEKSSAHLPIHHGMYIDIFPLDGYPAQKHRQLWLEVRKKLYLQLLGTAFAEPEPLKSRIIFRIKRFFGLQRYSAVFARGYENMIRSFPAAGSSLWCNHGNWQGRLEYAPRAQYGRGTGAVFEGLPVRIPEQYDAYLRQKYGDYHQDPPKEEQVGHHYHTVCDPDRPYTFYTDLKGDEI